MGNTCSCCSNAIRFPEVEDVSHLDEVILFIETRLDAILIDKPQESTCGAEIAPGVASFIEYGSYFLENVVRRVKRHTCKIHNSDIQKVVNDILKGAEQVQWVGAGLGVLAYVLDKISSNAWNECVDILCFMCGVAKHIKRRINRLVPEKLNDLVVFTVKGSIFCMSRMQSTTLSSSFSALVDEEEINSLPSQLIIKFEELGRYPDEDDNQNAVDLHDLSGLDELMSYIEKCFAQRTATDKAEENTSPVASSIMYGSALLRNVLKCCKEHAFKIMSGETRKVVIDVLKEATQIQWVGAGLSVVAYVLQKVDDASANKEECVLFLQHMYALAKHIKRLDGHITDEKLNDVTEFIFKGSFFCVSRIQSTKLSRFFSAVVDVEEINTLQSELGHKYQDLTLEAVTKLLEAQTQLATAVTQLSSKIPVVLPPSQGNQTDAVGINEPREHVIRLLDLASESAICVVLYGFGGIGKTTLATDVFSSLKLDTYKYCRVDIQHDCREPDLKQLQEQVLNDLFGQKYELRSCEEGKQKLSKLLRDPDTQRIFLFIDNALRGSDLAKLLPRDLSCLPNGSRILITTRKLDETDMIEGGGVKRFEYDVKVLPDSESKKLLCLKALGSADKAFDNSLDINIDLLVKICSGVPLVLDMVGSKLRKLGNDIDACENTIQFLRDTIVKGEGDLSEKVVDGVYNTLQENMYKDAFLDIAVFFNNWDQRTVGCIVGEVALKAIEEAALVKISEEGIVIVHDIVQARGRKLSEEDRITELESFQSALQDQKRLEKVKGIHLSSRSSHEQEFQLGAEYLDKMHKCLRVLRLETGITVTGACTKRFENLRYIRITNGYHPPMDLNKLPVLAILEGRIRSDNRFCDLPHSLRKLKVEDLRSPKLDESFVKLPRLEELELINCSTLSNLSDDFGQLRNLKKLVIKNCKSLSHLSDNFGTAEVLRISEN